MLLFSEGEDRGSVIPLRKWDPVVQSQLKRKTKQKRSGRKEREKEKKVKRKNVEKPNFFAYMGPGGGREKQKKV